MMVCVPLLDYRVVDIGARVVIRHGRILDAQGLCRRAMWYVRPLSMIAQRCHQYKVSCGR